MPRLLLAVLVALVLATVACASTTPRAEPTPNGLGSVVLQTITPAQPSRAALMVCGSTIRQSIATTLGLKTLPTAVTSWHDGLYSCRFDLPDGALILRVKEFPDVPSALQYIEAARAAATPTAPIEGLANLGLPAYRSPRGVVIFLKDAMTLEVDASALPPRLGPQGVGPADFAYQLATNVLACWTGQH